MRSYPSTDLVSVIVPAFNAADTVCDTVRSALNQTHRNLEIIIVDDGSTDQTQAVASSFVERDPRVRYVRKDNGGVASARNRGIAEARGEFVAPLDADDLWYPTKLERQLERFEQTGPETALVYAWCCWIDNHGTVTNSAPPTRFEGSILPEMCLGNVVISGSNALIRRNALIAAGGFDESLRRRGAQGCEDWKLCLVMAKRHKIAMVPEYLVGYRVSHGSMSDDFEQMMRSRRLVEAEFISAHPELARQLARGGAILARSLALRAIERGQIREAMKLLTNQSQGRVATDFAFLSWLMGGAIRRTLRWLRIGGRRTGHEFLATDQHGLGHISCFRQKKQGFQFDQ
jgi:glycosyltransferase involved in cell wall biosynthesis